MKHELIMENWRKYLLSESPSFLGTAGIGTEYGEALNKLGADPEYLRKVYHNYLKGAGAVEFGKTFLIILREIGLLFAGPLYNVTHPDGSLFLDPDPGGESLPTKDQYLKYYKDSIEIDAKENIAVQQVVAAIKKKLNIALDNDEDAVAAKVNGWIENNEDEYARIYDDIHNNIDAWAKKNPKKLQKAKNDKIAGDAGTRYKDRAESFSDLNFTFAWNAIADGKRNFEQSWKEGKVFDWPDGYVWIGLFLIMDVLALIPFLKAFPRFARKMTGFAKSAKGIAQAKKALEQTERLKKASDDAMAILKKSDNPQIQQFIRKVEAKKLKLQGTN